MVRVLHRLLPLLSVAAIALPAPARAQAELGLSGGQLGGTLTYQLDVPASSVGHFVFLLISVTEGPFPMAILNPTDPRVMDVGLELLDFASFGVFAAPHANIAYGLPLNPNLQGLPFYGQFLTVSLTTLQPDLISNRADLVLGQPQHSLYALGPVDIARQGHSVTALDGDRVLVLGGDRVNGMGTIVGTEDSWELYDPVTQKFTTSTNTLGVKRSTHTATRLLDGRVLICGGYADNASGQATATCEIYDPLSDTTTTTTSMSLPRTQHSATLLADGRVLVAGGAEKFDLADIFASLAVAIDTTEIYDPVAQTWTAGPTFPEKRFAHTATRMQDGRVLIASGVQVFILPFGGIPVPSFTNLCHLYNPTTNAFDAAPSIPGTSGFAYAGAAALPSGNVVLAGGADGDLVLLNINTRNQTYIFDGTSWTSGAPLHGSRAYAQLLELGSGKLLVIGGLASVDAFSGTGTPQTAIETSSAPAIGWTHTSTMDTLLPREVARSAVLDGGQKVLTVGNGDNGDGNLIDKTAEIYLP